MANQVKTKYPEFNPLPPQPHQIMQGINKPEQHDVLFGRGVVCNRHSGNKYLRELLDDHAECFSVSTKRQREFIAQSIVSHVRYNLGGKFLEKDNSCLLWFDAGDKRALAKITRQLRDRCAGVRNEEGKVNVST